MFVFWRSYEGNGGPQVLQGSPWVTHMDGPNICTAYMNIHIECFSIYACVIFAFRYACFTSLHAMVVTCRQRREHFSTNVFSREHGLGQGLS